MRIATYDEIADQLTDGYWEWLDGARHSFDVAPGDTLTADITGLTPEEQQLARWALEAWTNVTGIKFRFVTSGAHSTFDHDVGETTAAGSGGAIDIGPDGEILKSGVHISTGLIEDQGAAIDSFSLFVFVHEIGHALGLGHPGDYPSDFSNPEATYPDDAKFLNDSHQASLMSYFDQDQNTDIDASYANVATPMMADIIAVQNLYGVPDSINTGDTVYGYGSNVGGYLGQLFAAMSGEDPDSDVYDDGPVALTIYDNAGNDTLDLRWDADDQRVDLRPEGISDVLGLTGNLIIARDTAIENFVAGSGNDAVTGNDAANRLEGRAGHDTLSGGTGADRLEGGEGNDRLAGGAGADAMDGGAGRDRLWHEGSDEGVNVNFSTGNGSAGDAEGDTFENVEGVIGSAHADTLTGGDGNDWLSGQGGDDVLDGRDGNDALVGGPGADAMDGGAGHDRLWYGGSDVGVAVDLSAGTASGGHAEADTFENVEGVGGSRHADTLSGGSGNDWLGGGTGDDMLTGGAGADRLVGGADGDTASYRSSNAGVRVFLRDGSGTGGHAQGDTLLGIEHLEGSAHPDTFVGNGAANRLSGGAGDDRLYGDSGDDTLTGGAGNDLLNGGGGADTASYAGSDAGVRVHLGTGAATAGHAQGDTLSGIEDLEGSAHPDTLTGNDAANRLWGGEGDDTLAGGDGNDTLAGGAGADSMDGGAGNDWLSYAGSDAGVNVSLSTATGSGGHAEGDTFGNVEGIVGSAHADTLWGSSGNDTLTGGDGDDQFTGGAGADSMDGGDGYDWLWYGESDAGVHVNLSTRTASGGHAEGDTLENVEAVGGSAHADTLTGGAGDDWLGGGNGDDALAGGDGNDGLDGGAGADSMDGGAGYDWLWYWGSDAGVAVDLSTGTGSGGHAQGDTFENVEAVDGSEHADTLTGGAGDNWLGGNDGDDTLTGGDGNDALDGGAGNDSLTGGYGDDTFQLDGAMPNGEDVIRDFADDPSPDGEQDLIALFGDLTLTFESLVLTASGNDVVVTADTGTGSIHVTLENYLVDHELSDLTAEDFAFWG